MTVSGHEYKGTTRESSIEAPGENFQDFEGPGLDFLGQADDLLWLA